MRTVKSHQTRKNELLDTAESLFFTKGYDQTTVQDILQAAGIAKGTFYHYFKSKEEMMDAVVIRYIEAGVAAAEQIVSDPGLTVHEKLLRVVMAQKPEAGVQERLLEQFHEPQNALLHQKSLTETLLRLTPVLTRVIEQGKAEGLFHTPFPRESVEFLLAASQFLFDEGLFHWQPEALSRKIEAFIHIMETVLGAETGSLAYAAGMFGQSPDQRKEKDRPDAENAAGSNT